MPRQATDRAQSQQTAIGDTRIVSERGVVRFFDQQRGFGFASPDNGGADVYLHMKQCAGVGGALLKGDRIEFEIVHDDTQGKKFWAKDIRVI